MKKYKANKRILNNIFPKILHNKKSHVHDETENSGLLGGFALFVGLAAFVLITLMLVNYSSNHDYVLESKKIDHILSGIIFFSSSYLTVLLIIFVGIKFIVKRKK